MSLDGAPNERPLLDAPRGPAVQDVRVSADGKLVAITLAQSPAGPGELHIVDVSTGVERLTLSQSDVRFAGVRGQFWQLLWRDDGAGVVISMATHSEMYGSLVTVFLDGHMRTEIADGFGIVSPTGRARAGTVGQIACMLVGSHEIVARDLDTGDVPWRSQDDARIFTPWEWSPDGTTFVFGRRDVADCDSAAAATVQFWMVGPDRMPRRVPDLRALHRQWYGDRLFTVDCDMADQPVVDSFGDSRLGCTDSGPSQQLVQLRLGGVPIGSGAAPEPVGVMEP